MVTSYCGDRVEHDDSLSQYLPQASELAGVTATYTNKEGTAGFGVYGEILAGNEGKHVMNPVNHRAVTPARNLENSRGSDCKNWRIHYWRQYEKCRYLSYC